MSENKFLDAFNKSISVAETKKINLDEIYSIFASIDDEISTGTSNNFSIVLKKSVLPAISAFLNTISKSAVSDIKEEYYLEVINNKNGHTFNMSDIKFGDQGYPVQLFFKNNSLTSNSAESLKNDLLSILGSASFGEELEKIM